MAKSKPRRNSSFSQPVSTKVGPEERRPRWRKRAGACVAIAIGGVGAVVAILSWSGSGDPRRPPASDDPLVTPTATAASLSQVVTMHDQRRADERARMLDPTHDGWETEEFSERATSQLRRIAERLAQPTTRPLESLAPLLADEFHCSALCPIAAKEIAVDQRVRVFRGDEHSGDSDHAGLDGLGTALERLTLKLGTLPPSRFAHLKIYRVREQSASVETTVKLEASGRSDSTRQQVTSTWLCNWSKAVDSPPKLQSIRMLDYECVTIDGAADDWLSDRTSDVLGDVTSFRNELQYGMDYWVNRLDRRLMISRFGHHGLAIADVDGDGWDDVYVCQPGGLPNRLFVQDGAGAVRDRSSHSGVDFLDATSSAVFADLDNDGDQDLVLATIPVLAIFSNDGTGVFHPRAAMTECDRAFSLSVTDYNQDGRLDIFACRYRPDARHDFELPLPVPYHDANNGGRNRLFRNEGGWRFSDVTDQVGLDENNSRFSFAAAWEDYDNDGDQDLYVANDFGRNCLYENQGGHFRDRAASLGVEDIASGMSVTWGDYNHDGRMDLYVSNMFSSAGNRISFQSNFAASHLVASRAQLQRHARGNTLFENIADKSSEGTIAVPAFRDVSIRQAVTFGRWAWASMFADINNDTWDDLLVVNGLVTTEDPGDL